MLSRIASSALLAFALAIAPAAFAAPILSGIEYVVLDHPDGDLAPPDYALRLDGLDGNPDHDFTFSADSNGAALTILLDSTADTLTISGTVYGGEVLNNAYVNEQLWAIEFVYQGLSDFGDSLEATPGGGSGSITALGDGGSAVGPFSLGQVFALEDKANMDGLAFRLDFGHRVANDETVTGHGWLTHDGLTPRPDAQDWLFTVGDPVPEPSTALLLGVGLLTLSYRRLRR